MDFIIETSARHAHVTKEDLKILFGEDAKLTVLKELSQPGQFASNQRISVVGPKGTLNNVMIIGPERSATQVELSATDARNIGIQTAIRESGDLDGTAGCKIVGPCGEVELNQGVIIAKRHIHVTIADSEKLNLKNEEIVWVKLNTSDRSTIFGDVVVRVSDDFATAMHVDTDEANAAGCFGEVKGHIIKF